MSNSSHPKSWRDVLPIHPAAELFRAMSEPELRELGEDIKANGLRVPIVLHKGKQLLDGRNRLDAMELVGIKFRFARLGNKFVHFHGCDDSTIGSNIFGTFEHLLGNPYHLDGDPYGFVLSANIHRRHLTAEQKRDLIEKLLKAKPEQSDRQIAKQTKTSPTTVGAIRKKAEAAGDVSKLDTRNDTKGRKQPSTKPIKPAKPASPTKIDPIGSPPVRYSEVPATPVPPESRPGSVSANDKALEDFTAKAMELVWLTRNQNARRFIETALPDEGIRQLARPFSDLIKIRNEKVVDRICGTAEISTEQRKAEHAALDGTPDDLSIPAFMQRRPVL
jgi:hypothetical protein